VRWKSDRLQSHLAKKRRNLAALSLAGYLHAKYSQCPTARQHRASISGWCWPFCWRLSSSSSCWFSVVALFIQVASSNRWNEFINIRRSKAIYTFCLDLIAQRISSQNIYYLKVKRNVSQLRNSKSASCVFFFYTSCYTSALIQDAEMHLSNVNPPFLQEGQIYCPSSSRRY